MACRTRKPHYHYYDEIKREAFCKGCGVLLTDLWMRCHDRYKLCNTCYWADHELRWLPANDKVER